MSELKATATPFKPSTSWADDDGSDDGDITKDFDALSPKKATSQQEEQGSKVTNSETDQPVASLASRISGLTTGESSTSSSTPSSSELPALSAPAVKGSVTRPKFNAGGNNLFGRALAGAKSDRPAASTSTSSPATKESATSPSGESTASTPKKEEKTGTMSNVDLMDNDDGWGNNASTNANHAMSEKATSQQAGDGWGDNAGETNTDNNGDGNESKNMLEERMSEGTGLISNEFQVEVKLADQQADPNSPLYSIKDFDKLPIHPDLLKGIYAAKFKRPSKIQEKALPMLLNNPPRNLIGQSQSGTGKTAAFTLNMLSRVDPSLMTPQAICLAPSRELARQIQEVVEKIGQFTPIKSHLAVPGSWSRNVKIDKHILIGTPGTLVDMLSRRGSIFDPAHIRVFVLDEADEMINLQGLGDQTKRIQRMLPAGVQNVLFSATFPDHVKEFANEFAPEANQIFLKKEEVTVEAIKQLYLECDGEQQKFEALSALYDIMTIGQSIVFCKKKSTADEIAERLTSEGHSVASLHGDKMTGERDQILDSFRDGKTKVLITTNVVARGIDIQQVNMVVNYDVPDMGREDDFKPDIETYIHRIGRTGRFGRKGCSVIFAHDQRSMDDVKYIAEALGKPMRRINATSQTDLEQLEVALKAAMKAKPYE